MDNAEKLKSRPGFKLRRRNYAALGEYAPRFSLALDAGDRGSELYRSFPFRRHWPAIAISFALLAAFSVPLFLVGGSMLGGYDGELFSLVFILFTLFWMLGWSVGVLVLALVFIAITFGRETLRVRDNALILRLGIPGLGFGATYHGDAIRQFRRRRPEEATGNGWRGDHLVFDYGDDTIGFGSAIDAEQARQILGELKALFPRQASAPMQFAAASEGGEQAEPLPAAIEGTDRSAPEAAGTLGSLSSLALIVANLIPLAGVLLYDWNIGQIMLLFWAESAVIGFYTLCKMGKIGGWLLLLYGPFFVGHFGAFMAVHLLFIYGLFVGDINSNQDMAVSAVFTDFIAMTPALLGFFISHGISYYSNFLGRQEYRDIAIREQMFQPYKRIILMHVTIIFGGFLVLAFNTPLAALALFILLKLAADLRAHVREHASP